MLGEQGFALVDPPAAQTVIEIGPDRLGKFRLLLGERDHTVVEGYALQRALERGGFETA